MPRASTQRFWSAEAVRGPSAESVTTGLARAASAAAFAARRSESRCTCQKPSRRQTAATSMRPTMAIRRDVGDMRCLWSRTRGVAIGHGAAGLTSPDSSASGLGAARSGVCRDRGRRPGGLRPNITTARLPSCASRGAARQPRSPCSSIAFDSAAAQDAPQGLSEVREGGRARLLGRLLARGRRRVVRSAGRQRLQRRAVPAHGLVPRSAAR